MTKTHKMWLTPLTIPEGKAGEYAIEHKVIPAGGKVPFNNLRNQMLGGQKGVSHITYPMPTTWHKLTGPTGTWMTDLPIEHRQMKACLKGMKGRVLVGELGLGLAVSLLNKRKAVTRIDVVEISPEVIRLVRPHLPSQWNPKGRDRGWVINTFNDDLFGYLKHYDGEPYDYAFFDIWQSDSEDTFFEIVVPLIQLSKGKVKHPPVCWNENVMRGQLLQSLHNRLLFLKPEAGKLLDPFPQARSYWVDNPPWQEKNDKWHDWCVPFFKWWHETQPDERQANNGAVAYACLYGTWDWEEKWHIFCESPLLGGGEVQ